MHPDALLGWRSTERKCDKQDVPKMCSFSEGLKQCWRSDFSRVTRQSGVCRAESVGAIGGVPKPERSQFEKVVELLTTMFPLWVSTLARTFCSVCTVGQLGIVVLWRIVGDGARLAPTAELFCFMRRNAIGMVSCIVQGQDISG